MIWRIIKWWVFLVAVAFVIAIIATPYSVTEVTTYITYENGDTETVKRVAHGYHGVYLDDGCVTVHANKNAGTLRCGVRRFSYTTKRIEE